MRVTLYYFSGTGNSLYVAKELKRLLPEAEAVPILSLKDRRQMYSLPAGAVGFVYPIYMNALPKPVKTFIDRCDFSSVNSVFAVATHGGFPGKAGAYLNSLLQVKGQKLDQYFQVRMIMNTPKGVAPKPLMRLEWEKDITAGKVSAALAPLDECIKEVADTILKGDPSPCENAGFFTRQLWRISGASNPKLEFTLDSTCNGCGMCEKVCPSGRVQLQEGRPRWNKGMDCFYCYACFNFCPIQAIGVKHYTKKMGRYHHPGITSEEIAEQKQKG